MVFEKKILASIFSFSLIIFTLFINVTLAEAASTIVVNSNSDVSADDGLCTLREAITASNSDTASGATLGECIVGSGVDTIEFNITGAADFVNGGQNGYTIEPLSELPTITQTVTIDGYTQPGSSVNTEVSPAPINSNMLIEINCDNTPLNGSGNLFCLANNADNSAMKGLSVFGAKVSSPANVGTDIRIENADNVKIQGMYVGLRADGVTTVNALPGGGNSGLNYFGTSNNGIVGGVNPEDRNIIGKGEAGGLGLDTGSSSHLVYGNYICVGKDGLTDLSCTNGAAINADDSIFGGPSVGMRNLISGARDTQLAVLGQRTKIQNNYFGSDYSGASNTSLSNGSGVVIVGGIDILVGGTAAGEGNIFSGLIGAAVAGLRLQIPAYSIDLSPRNNAIVGNIISDQGDLINLIFNPDPIREAIDLYRAVDITNDFVPDNGFDVSQNVNDPAGFVAGEANDYLNHPVINSSIQSGQDLAINFDVSSGGSASGVYRIEFFVNDTNTRSEANAFVGFVNVAPGTGEVANFTLPGNLVGKYVVASATRIDGGIQNDGLGSTSEFSNARIVVAPDDSNGGGGSPVQNPSSGEVNLSVLGSRSSNLQGNLASTGSNFNLFFPSLGLIISGLVIRRIRQNNKSRYLLN
jgi:CSLREA domain-containing protein